MMADLHRTFDERHAPYMNGTKRLEGLPDPASWNKPTVIRKPSRRHKKGKKERSTPAPAAVNDDDEYVYDSEENTWIKLE